MVSLDRFVDQLQAGSWSVDCLEMTLSKHDVEQPVTYKGPGYLRQGEDGGIIFGLYPISPRRVPWAAAQGPASVPGKIIERKEFFRLVARTADGCTWTCEQIIPSVGGLWRSDGIEPVVGGELAEIKCERPIQFPNESDYLNITIFGDIQIPCNRDTLITTDVEGLTKGFSAHYDRAFCPTDHGDIWFHSEKGRLTIFLTPKTPTPQHLETRIVEALSLILATPLSWNVVILRSGAVETIRVRARKRIIKAKFHRPIGIMKDRDIDGDVWRLFSYYLRLVSEHEAASFHPVSRHIFAVLESSVGGITSSALTLGVAVEGIAGHLFKRAGAPLEGMKEVIEPLKARLLAWDELPEGELGESLTKRLPGMLSQLGSISTKDRLHALAKASIIDVGQIKEWSNLRDRAAHGVTPGSNSVQKLVDLVNKVTVLMYFLIFKGVGYEGRFQDYSTYGFPTKRYRGRAPSHEEIAVAAYFIYEKENEERGFVEHGHDAEHWQKAEERLKARLI